VSTEVDVKHSFSVLDTVAAAIRIIDAYQRESVPRTGVRIKISATWEGIQAGRILELQHGVSVLITVVFGLTQAITAAEAGVSCIAPYVGRIGDWYQAHSLTIPDGHREDDMGVLRVREMQNYLRKYDFKTQVMAASFRSTKQVRDLAGIDLMTIAPAILQQMEEEDAGSFEPSLTAYTAMLHFPAPLTFLKNCVKPGITSKQHKMPIYLIYLISTMRALSDGHSTRMLAPSRNQPRP
jgi:transaldolase